MWLTVSVSGQQAARRQPVGGSPVVGRAPDCDVVVDDGHVSQRHARLDVGPDGAWVTDLNSTNGTYVQGTRVAGRAWVPVNGEFQVGAATLRLCGDQPTEAFTPGPAGPAAGSPWAPPSGPAWPRRPSRPRPLRPSRPLPRSPGPPTGWPTPGRSPGATCAWTATRSPGATWSSTRA